MLMMIWSLLLLPPAAAYIGYGGGGGSQCPFAKAKTNPNECTDPQDLSRAQRKRPGDALMGRDHRDMTTVLNSHLQSVPGLRVAPCDSFSIAQLTQLQRTLFAARNPALNSVYERTADNRRLAAFGEVSENISRLEELWEREAAVLQRQPALLNMSRSGKCHEAVMWYVHHIPDGMKPKLHSSIRLPLLPQKQSLPPYVEATAAAEVQAAYEQGIGCSACHAAGASQGNNESVVWPAELSYNATGYGAFPFWDNTGPGCTYCDPSVDSANPLRVLYSSKLNSELLMHTSCGDMSWTGGKGAPKKSPCNHLFNQEEGAFIYTPKSALSTEADGAFCCRTYNAGDSSFPGAVPKDWMRSMNYWGQASGFKGDYYEGDVKIYWSNAGGLDFWYYEGADGQPVEQGEGCYFPGVKTKKACAYTLPIMLWHDYDPSTFKEDTFTAEDFAVPDVCKNTKISCSAPGGGASLSQGPLGLHQSYKQEL